MTVVRPHSAAPSPSASSLVLPGCQEWHSSSFDDVFGTLRGGGLPRTDWASPLTDISSLQVAGTAETSDGVLHVTFDAAPFLRTASLDQLNNLRACGWGHQRCAYSFAVHVAKTHTSVARVIDRGLENSQGPDATEPGFYCSVNPDAAALWVRHTHPDFAQRHGI